MNPDYIRPFNMQKLYLSKVETLYQAGPLLVGAIQSTNSGPAWYKVSTLDE